jgi:MFS transporter, PPP family, 3-phenylpropionic acid transporter
MAASPPLAWPLSTFYFVSFGVLGMHAPYFPLWLEAHGFEGMTMSAIAALSPAMSFFGPPLVGAVSDARGARGNLLGAACLLSSSAMAGLCLAEALGQSRLFGLVFAAVLVYSACRSPVILLADRIALEHGGDYGSRRAWGSLGFLVAVAAFGSFCPPRLWRWLPGMLAAALALSYLVSLRLPRVSVLPHSPASGQVRRLLGQRGFVVFLVCSGASAASHVSYDLCGSLFFRDLGASGKTIGLLWTSGVVAEIALLGTASRWRVLRPELLLVVAYGGGALRWFLTSQLASTDLAFLVQPLHALSFGLVWLSSLDYVRRSSEPRALGSAQGLFMAANACGGVIGMLIWGPLYASHGGASVFLLATSGSLGAAALAYLGLYRRGQIDSASGLASAAARDPAARRLDAPSGGG